MYNIFGSYINDDFSNINPTRQTEYFTNINPTRQTEYFTNINPTRQPDYKNNSSDIISSLQISSDIHKKVREYLYPCIKPGMKLLDIVNIIESKTIELSLNQNTINKGIGFPVSISLNDCAAHFHPEYNSTISFNKKDVLKIDFGVENNGWIIDCAFTVCFDIKYDPLLNAVKEATYTGIKNAGIDVRLGEWGCEIQEVMESHEIVLNNKTHQIKSIKNLGGHNILNRIIHGNVFLPIVDMTDSMNETDKFKEGVYAIETFGSTGVNYIIEKGESTLFRLNPEKTEKIHLHDLDILNFYNKIKTSFSTIPFTNRYIQNFNTKYKEYLKILDEKKIIYSYPPLYVNPSAYTAQYEHTIYIDESKKYILSKGDDY